MNKTYTPFFKYMKEKHGVSILFELIHGAQHIPISQTVEMTLEDILPPIPTSGLGQGIKTQQRGV